MRFYTVFCQNRSKNILFESKNGLKSIENQQNYPQIGTVETLKPAIKFTQSLIQ
jgi:hypothetical protein